MTGDCVPISVDSQRCLVLGMATAAPVHYLRREVSTAATRPFGFFLDSLRPCLAKGLLADNPVAGDALFPTPIAAPCDGNVWQRCGAVHHFIMYSLVESFTLYPAQRHKSS